MDTKREKLLDRARKLFAMSQDDSSPHEAEIAMKRLTKLMDELGVTAEELEQKRVEFDSADGETFKAMPTWYTLLCSATSNLTDTRAVIHRNRTARESRMSFEGMNGDSAIAILTLDYLIDTMKRSLKDYLASGDPAMDIAMGYATTRKLSSDFRMGFARAIAERARDIANERKEKAQQAASTGTSLVVQKNAMIDEHFGRLARHTIKTSSRPTTAGYGAGKEAGQNAGLNTQVTASAPPNRIAS